MTDDMVPLDGSPSKAAWEVFSSGMKPDVLERIDTMLGGWNAETVCSYAAGEVPDNVYSIMLSALRWREQTLRDGIAGNTLVSGTKVEGSNPSPAAKERR